ncbi:MAG: hypothetical protein Q9217_005931 [Psora testacea]
MFPPSRRLLLLCFWVASFIFFTQHPRILLPAASYSNSTRPEVTSTKTSVLQVLEVNGSGSASTNTVAPTEAISTVSFYRGIPKPPEASYSRVMVVPRMKDEDVSWMNEELPDLNVTVYVANDPMSPLHPPKNKGHEVMVYFSYIIDHYEQLPDITIFMHAHRFTHHNNELLEYDAAEMLRRLSNEHVIRQGYVNMRCSWSPGCPEWLHPDPPEELLGRQEEAVLAESWHELFPHNPLPKTLAQACCAQFALSKERILAIPRSRFVFYRDWIMRTPLSDYVSGRIWEYSWQFLFTSQSVFCPAEHICYCDGYGLCFGGLDRYNDFEQLRHTKQKYEQEFNNFKKQQTTMFEGEGSGNSSVATMLQTFDARDYNDLRDRIEALEKELNAQKEEAIERGKDPRNRASECGRPWKEGEGY